MLDSLQKMGSALDAMLASLDHELLAPKDAVAVLEAASAVEQRAASIKTLVADRAADAGTWSREGHRSPEEWLSTKTGTSYGEAAATLDASAKLPGLPAIGAALRKGELSAPRLRAIAEAATQENEERLLGASKRESFTQLRRTCNKEKASARSMEEERERHGRIHRQRHYRSWNDDDGAYRFEGKTTAIEGARIEAAIGAEADRVFKQAWREGRREPAAAYRVDALANLINGGGAQVQTSVVIRADAERMSGGAGLCETATGEVPVDEAIGAILAGAFVKVLLRDGVDVTRVHHAGRHLPAELKTAVFERDRFGCVRPGCGATQRLEVHHYKVDYAKGGATAYWNLATVCSHDHDLISRGGHRLGGGPGSWSWIPPPP
ncbi:MAG: hypothetical protein QOG87_3435 [Actinomycetota bacterium]